VACLRGSPLGPAQFSLPSSLWPADLPQHVADSERERQGNAAAEEGVQGVARLRGSLPSWPR